MYRIELFLRHFHKRRISYELRDLLHFRGYVLVVAVRHRRVGRVCDRLISRVQRIQPSLESVALRLYSVAGLRKLALHLRVCRLCYGRVVFGDALRRVDGVEVEHVQNLSHRLLKLKQYVFLFRFLEEQVAELLRHIAYFCPCVGFALPCLDGLAHICPCAGKHVFHWVHRAQFEKLSVLRVYLFQQLVARLPCLLLRCLERAYSFAPCAFCSAAFLCGELAALGLSVCVVYRPPRRAVFYLRIVQLVV